MNLALRILLLLWVLGYLLVACGPILGGHLIIGAVTLVAGIALFIPWLLGIAVLGFLIWITNPARPR